ncbi:MAG: MFS transporter [Bacteroidetes bacterium]|jgi:OFA family oxalate/formate antiporter-like MFS transporter|nr:MFS transporter [Bacteroidota bacterium]
MHKYLTVFASFVIMLCIGSVYAWSIIASELIDNYGFSASQSQVIFGTLIAIFPATMIFVGRLSRKISFRYIGHLSGILFFTGYIVASYSLGNFIIIFLGIGVLGGIGTGFGYWVALSSPVKWFPERKGLITGISAAGFGLGAVFMSGLSEKFLSGEKDVLQLLRFIGIAYGLIILIFSNFIYQHQSTLNTANNKRMKISEFGVTSIFKKLFLGIFLGTFAGLLIIGSLKIIGEQGNISTRYLILGVSLFAVANFLGRLVWGFLSDYLGASLGIFGALLFQSAAIICLNFIALSGASYLVLAFFIGFGFGGNFVLFAKETAQVFGVINLGIIYPYVFLGYAIAGIAGPFTGGALFDHTGSFAYSIFIAGGMSLAGSMLFLHNFFITRKDGPVKIN